MKSKTRDLFKGIYNRWIYLRGPSGEFPLHSRIYHALVLIIFAVMIYNVPFSIALGLYELALYVLILLPVMYYLYYISRFRKKTNVSRTIFIGLFYVFFCVNYFANSGLDGSALFSFVTVYFLTMVAIPRRQYLVWTLVNIAIVGGLLVIEYNNPEWVRQSYSNDKERFIDIASTNLVHMLLTLICLSYIIGNYIKEKQVAERKALELNRLNRQQNRLISIVSHDFNAPLSNINQYLRLMRTAPLETEARENLERELARITTDTQSLLLNLLSWSRNNMERADVLPGLIAVEDVLDNTLSVYKPIAAGKGVTLVSRLTGEEVAWADFDMLEIVLRNLISNGVKFTEEGGVVSIESKELADSWRISVINTGEGIDPVNRELIFADNVVATYGTNKEKGAGIGLAICKEFIEKMGGRIGFESSPEGVTDFYIILKKEGDLPG